jgi:ComF family protein
MTLNKGGRINNIQKYGERFILDVIFPKKCIGCGVEGYLLCEECFSTIKYCKQKVCIRCGKETADGMLCKQCSRLLGIKNIIAAGDYNDKLWKDSIKYLKYHFLKDLACDLAELIKIYIEKETFSDSEIKKTLLSEKTFLAATPLHKKREKWRGFNQSEEIAKKLSFEYRLPLLPGLVKTANKKPQAKLSGQERKENLKNCFIWKGKDLSGCNIILIDDVVTTGTTMAECASVLKAAGAKNIFGLAAARG